MYDPMNPYGQPPVQQGWKCPCCNRVYSPSTAMCIYCGNNTTETHYDTTGSPVPKDRYPQTLTETELYNKTIPKKSYDL